MQIQSLDQEASLEEGTATRSGVLAWRILGQRSLAGYSPQGRRELDTTDLAHTHTPPKKSSLT